MPLHFMICLQKSRKATLSQKPHKDEKVQVSDTTMLKVVVRPVPKKIRTVK